MKKVFLIGRRRTGIATIRKAIQMIGFKKSQILLESKSKDIESLIKEMQDYDFCAMAIDYTMNDIRAIEAAYPDCQFILTKRSPIIWYASFVRYYNSLKGDHPQTVHKNQGHYVSKYYEEYNEQVRSHFAGRAWKLLTFSFDGKHGWSQLCSFFKKPVPNKPFPHTNRAK